MPELAKMRAAKKRVTTSRPKNHTGSGGISPGVVQPELECRCAAGISLDARSAAAPAGAYAEREGVDIDTFLNALGPTLTP